MKENEQSSQARHADGVHAWMCNAEVDATDACCLMYEVAAISIVIADRHNLVRRYAMRHAEEAEGAFRSAIAETQHESRFAPRQQGVYRGKELLLEQLVHPGQLKLRQTASERISARRLNPDGVQREGSSKIDAKHVGNLLHRLLMALLMDLAVLGEAFLTFRADRIFRELGIMPTLVQIPAEVWLDLLPIPGEVLANRWQSLAAGVESNDRQAVGRAECFEAAEVDLAR